MVPSFADIVALSRYSHDKNSFVDHCVPLFGLNSRFI